MFGLHPVLLSYHLDRQGMALSCNHGGLTASPGQVRALKDHLPCSEMNKVAVQLAEQKLSRDSDSVSWVFVFLKWVCAKIR